MNCYMCIDENFIIWGLFESENEAKFYADIINQDPEIDTIIKVREYGIMPKGYNKEFIKKLAERMIKNVKDLK